MCHECHISAFIFLILFILGVGLFGWWGVLCHWECASEARRAPGMVQGEGLFAYRDPTERTTPWTARKPPHRLKTGYFCCKQSKPFMTFPYSCSASADKWHLTFLKCIEHCLHFRHHYMQHILGLGTWDQGDVIQSRILGLWGWVLVYVLS